MLGTLAADWATDDFSRPFLNLNGTSSRIVSKWKKLVRRDWPFAIEEVKAVRVKKHYHRRWLPLTREWGFTKTKDMKTLARFALAAVLFATTFVAQADPVRGYFRSNGTYVAPHYRSESGSLKSSVGSGYVYRNPYAAYPSVSVDGYTRNNGTFVLPHRRTPPNDTVTDNLNYRGFGTIRVPRETFGR